MISFHNTETAFRHKSNNDLRRASQLFSVISNPRLVSLGNSLAIFGLKIGLPIKGIIKATLFKQFVGGETIEDCEKTIRQLHQYGVGTILDYSVEGKSDEETFDACTAEILRTIDKAKGNPAIPFSVFKVTGLGPFELLEAVNANEALGVEDQAAFDRLKKRVEKICSHAFASDVRIFVDAEDSWIQNVIDHLAEEMMAKFNRKKAIVFNTIQMYRHDRLAYLRKVTDGAKSGNYFLGLKVVRGAYMEKERARAAEMNYPDPIQPTKAATDTDYNIAIKFCIQNLDVISFCAGTHNEDSCMLLVNEMQKSNVTKNDERVWFAQLLGMSDHISFNLSSEGYHVGKYVPYGPVKELIPYLSRRAQENTSVKGQTGRELSLIKTELERRKKG
jgi:proline dehydrogenase